MRAMIVAAGMGTRLRPLSDLRPKPAVPVRGLPLVAYSLALLAQHGVREVVINQHPLPWILEDAARRHRPESLELRFSHEPQLLDTGGGVRKVAGFLRESDPCLLLGGDMLLDADLGGLVARHLARGDAATLLLTEDPRAPRFGTLGVDGAGRLRRIAGRLDLGGEERAGIWPWVAVLSPRAFDHMPDREVFVFLDDWIGGMLSAGVPGVRAEVASAEEITWEPVGRLEEYLAVNLTPRSLSYLDADARARAEGTHFGPGLVVGAGAIVEPGARLERAVVWDRERVPASLQASDGVFAGGTFHPLKGETQR
ncbi:MAG: NDP-sugar synthase [Myxococcota bacterium]